MAEEFYDLRHDVLLGRWNVNLAARAKHSRRDHRSALRPLLGNEREWSLCFDVETIPHPILHILSLQFSCRNCQLQPLWSLKDWWLTTSPASVMATSMPRPGGLAVGRGLNLQASNKNLCRPLPLNTQNPTARIAKELKRVRPRGVSKTWRPMSFKSSEIARSKTNGFSPQDQHLFSITGWALTLLKSQSRERDMWEFPVKEFSTKFAKALKFNQDGLR